MLQGQVLSLILILLCTGQTLWDQCECEAEFVKQVVLSLILILLCTGQTLWDQCECEAEFDILKQVVFCSFYHISK